jgi:segregation and condensation protein A
MALLPLMLTIIYVRRTLNKALMLQANKKTRRTALKHRPPDSVARPPCFVLSRFKGKTYLCHAMTYTIKLPQFEGPFDLLLFFIERDELDIYNIPIAKITDDFLAHLKQMEALNVDLASEFIVVAASLMRIKAKMLLPRKELNEEGQEIDPREELVQKLLEYKRYKSVLDEMRFMEDARALRETRGNTLEDLQKIASTALVDAELEQLTLFKLLNTFQKVLARFEDASRVATHRVLTYSYTIEGQKDYIISRVSKGRCDFVALFEVCRDRLHAIFNFLALLELAQAQAIRLTIGEGVNNFWVEASGFIIDT